MDLPEINVGNDATPALFDVDNDGRLILLSATQPGTFFYSGPHALERALPL